MADNRIAELTTADNKLLAEVFADIDTGEIPFMLSGYTEEDYGKIVTALSEAIHDDEDETEVTDEEHNLEQNGCAVEPGDLWIIGDEGREVDTGILDCIEEARGSSRIIIVQLETRLADNAVKMIEKETGSAGVRCVRQGRELSREEIAGIFGHDEEGGGQE